MSGTVMLAEKMRDYEDSITELNSEIRRLRVALVEIAQLGSYYADTPESIKIARKALGCKTMPY